MTVFDSIAQIRRDLPCLNPHGVKARVLELTRGGHRGSSFSTGRGGDPPAPTFDREDEQLNQLDATYRREIDSAAGALGRALAAQDKILARARKKLVEDENDLPLDAIWCRSCLRVEHFSPRGNPKRQGADTDLCTWCFDNQTDGDPDETGLPVVEWPPLELLALHARGVRITTKVAKEAGISA